jgi:hypothetical protein
MRAIRSVRDMPTNRRTLGDFSKELTLAAMTTGVGFVFAIIGSIGAWVSGPFGSQSGMNGGGKLTIALAIVGLLLVAFDRAAMIVPVIGLGLAVLGGWEWHHIHSVVHNAVLFGMHVASVGWGVYAVIVGGVLAFFTSLNSHKKSVHAILPSNNGVPRR